jgi:NADH-quinone oxidoreductase subunit J
LGILIGLVGLGGLGFTLLPPGLTLHGVLFYLFSGVAIAAAGSTITHHNPIYSALSFALVTLSVCGLFLLRGAQFLAAATIIIYAGAIVVTFLFIIMLARQSGNAPYDRRAREPFLSTLAAFLLLGGLLFTINIWVTQRAGNPSSLAPPGRLALAETADMGGRSLTGFVPLPAGSAANTNSNFVAGEKDRLRGLGRSLFSDYLIAVELAGTLLLVAGVGAVAIAPRRSTGKL